MSEILTYPELCAGFNETACLGRIELATGNGWTVVDIPPDIVNKLEMGLLSKAVTSQPPTPPPNTTEIPGGSFPFPMLAIGVIALFTWGAEQVSKRGADARRQRAIGGGHLGQASLSAGVPAPVPETVPQEHQGVRQVRTGTGSETADWGTGAVRAGTPQFEPSPWSMTEADRYSYQSDRTASTLTTADCWKTLNDCSYTEFCERISAGNVDPVSVVNSGIGGVAARDACDKWFRHGIKTQNKVCWAAFGTDGKGSSTKAKAAVQLFKEYLAEWEKINHG